MPTANHFRVAASPRVLLMTTRHFPTVQENIMRAGAARGWRMRFGCSLYDALPPVENYEGILFIGGSPDIRAWAATAACPVVRLFDAMEGDSFPSVDTDDRASGRMGAQHFLELGYHHLVFFSLMDTMCTRLRRDSFVKTTKRAGRKPVVLELPRLPSGEHVAKRRDDREKWLAAQLRRLPKPMGILPEDDIYAPELVQAALLAGLRVPQDVAVLAPDNLFPDHLAASPIPLSTLKANPCDAAVALLADLMAGRPAPNHPILIPPAGITVKASTAFFVSEVPGITDAVLHLRAHFRERVRATEVAKRAGMSVRKLQQEIKSVLGRTLSEELFRLRLDHAQRLLRETDMTMSAVAVESGFGDSTALHRAFKQAHAVSPGAYRLAVPAAAP